MLNSGTTKYQNMTQENHSSKQGENKTEELEKKVKNLEKILRIRGSFFVN